MKTSINAPNPQANWICDCKDNEIRWVDETRPHPAIVRAGWFCMGCLTEFLPGDSLERLEQERDRLRVLACDLVSVIRMNLMRSSPTCVTSEGADKFLAPFVERINSNPNQTQP